MGLVREYPRRARRNGCSLPVHQLQVLAWVFTIAFVASHVLVVSPSFVERWRPCVYVPFLLPFAIYVILSIVTSAKETRHPGTHVHKDFYGREIPYRDPNANHSVIIGKWCSLCECDIDGPKAKHCASCQKCIGGFDHHCRWLNNCIGARNYKLFIGTLVTACISCFTILVCCVVLFVSFFTDAETGDVIQYYSDGASFQIFYADVPAGVWLALISITALLQLIALALLLQLLMFHIKLYFMGMSTYEYILRMRDEEMARQAEAESKSEPASVKSNQVAPQFRKRVFREFLSCLPWPTGFSDTWRDAWVCLPSNPCARNNRVAPSPDTGTSTSSGGWHSDSSNSTPRSVQSAPSRLIRGVSPITPRSTAESAPPTAAFTIEIPEERLSPVQVPCPVEGVMREQATPSQRCNAVGSRISDAVFGVLGCCNAVSWGSITAPFRQATQILTPSSSQAAMAWNKTRDISSLPI